MEVKTFPTSARPKTWIVVVTFVLGIIWIYYFVLERKYLDLIAGIITILSALWFSLLIIKCRHAAVTIGPNGIQMDECASLVKSGRVTKPHTLTIGWEQIAKVEKHALTLYSGELFVILDNFIYLNELNKRYRESLTSSAINDDAWTEIERYHRIYKDKTQQ